MIPGNGKVILGSVIYRMRPGKGTLENQNIPPEYLGFDADYGSRSVNFSPSEKLLSSHDGGNV